VDNLGETVLDVVTCDLDMLVKFSCLLGSLFVDGDFLDAFLVGMFLSRELLDHLFH